MSGWTRGDVARRALELSALAVVLVALVYSGWFRIQGGHWERVESPSMGTTAPVGTLLWLRPVDTSALRVGDIISFHEPGIDNGPVYSHRVAEVHDDGTFGTAGDLSGTDVWTVQPTDVLGRVDHVWRGAGWLVRCAPVLVIGGLVTVGLVLLARRRGKVPIGILGASVTLTVAILVYQPLTSAEQLSIDQVDQGVEASFVSTGLLPVRLSAEGEEHVDLSSGEAGSVTASRPAQGRVRIGVKAAIPDLFWVLLVLGCFVPAAASAVVGRRERQPVH